MQNLRRQARQGEYGWASVICGAHIPSELLCWNALAMSISGIKGDFAVFMEEMHSQMVHRFLCQGLLNMLWIYSPEEFTKYTGSSSRRLHRHLHTQDSHSALHVLTHRCTFSSILSWAFSQHTCCCLSTKAVLCCESTNSEGKHKPDGENGRREVLKQVNNIICLTNFSIFPWGKDEVKRCSAHLSQCSCQLQFISNFNRGKWPPRIVQSVAEEGSAWKC